MSKTALLLSGGIDSASILWWRKPSIAYVIDYGQRPFQGEYSAAEAIAEAAGVRLRSLRADVGTLGAGDMSELPRLGISLLSEWWPFRNQHLVTIGAMAAVSDSVDVIEIGTVATDDGHVDGSEQFISKLDSLLSIQEGGVRLSAPAKHLTSPKLVEESQIPIEVLRLTHSCHTARYPCGRCRGCYKHAAVWSDLGR